MGGNGIAETPSQLPEVKYLILYYLKMSHKDKGLAAAILAKTSDGKTIDAEWKACAKKVANFPGGKHIGVFLNAKDVAYAEPVKKGRKYIWTTMQ